MKGKGLRAIVAVLLLAATLRVAWAEDEKQPTAMGGDSRDDRVSERARMQAEYESMRVERALALKRAREESAAPGGDHVPGWKDSGGTGWTGLRKEAAGAGSPDVEGKGPPSAGPSIVMIVAATFMLAFALLIRFRRGR